MSEQSIPFFGVRKFARNLLATLAVKDGELQNAREENARLKSLLAKLDGLSLLELESKRNSLRREIERINAEQANGIREFASAEATARDRLAEVHRSIVATEELAMLQEAGIYRYRHPLSDAVAFQDELTRIEERIKAAVKKDGGAVTATTSWTVNGSEVQGRKMVRDFSKLMLRAFNAEADNLVRGMKPYRLDAGVERLNKVAHTIATLGATMSIRISAPYLRLRVQELELTADFLHKAAEEKEVERAERERMREERKAQQEMERERARLEKEHQHYANALQALTQNGDAEGAARVQSQLADVQRAINDVDYRAANIRAGYVYVISNIGSFGESMVKVGMTRRLDPLDRIRELSDASVPFNFDVHALFFSKDAIGIEAEMHRRLAANRVNRVNLRREFFCVTPLDVKTHLAELAGELLQFQDVPEALEYREGLARPASA